MPKMQFKAKISVLCIIMMIKLEKKHFQPKLFALFASNYSHQNYSHRANLRTMLHPIHEFTRGICAQKVSLIALRACTKTVKMVSIDKIQTAIDVKIAIPPMPKIVM